MKISRIFNYVAKITYECTENRGLETGPFRMPEIAPKAMKNSKRVLSVG
jgi:hypothetical protein